MGWRKSLKSKSKAYGNTMFFTVSFEKVVINQWDYNPPMK